MKFLSKIFYLIYTIWFNFRYLSFRQAIKLPIKIRSHIRIEKLKKGQIEVGVLRHGIIRIGGGGSPGMNSTVCCLRIDKKAKLAFKGKTTISQGTVLRCDKNSSIIFGDNFYCNCNNYIRSTNLIEFGDDCTMGWGITINTNDGHKVWHKGILVKSEAPIKVGDHVWIAPDSSLNKGVTIPSHCIITQKAVVTKAFSVEHCLIGGIPAKIISTDIDWKA